MNEEKTASGRAALRASHNAARLDHWQRELRQAFLGRAELQADVSELEARIDEMLKAGQRQQALSSGETLQKLDQKLKGLEVVIARLQRWKRRREHVARLWELRQQSHHALSLRLQRPVLASRVTVLRSLP